MNYISPPPSRDSRFLQRNTAKANPAAEITPSTAKPYADTGGMPRSDAPAQTKTVETSNASKTPQTA